MHDNNDKLIHIFLDKITKDRKPLCFYSKTSYPIGKLLKEFSIERGIPSMTMEHLNEDNRGDYVVKYDVILGLFNLKSDSLSRYNKEFKSNANLMIHSIKFFASHSVGLFIVDPFEFNQENSQDFFTSLADKGAYLQGFIELPGKEIGPMIAVVGRCPRKQIFVEHLSASNLDRLVNLVLKGSSDSELKLIDQGSFTSFNHLKIKEQMDAIGLDQKHYETVNFSSLIANELQGYDQGFEEASNGLYFSCYFHRLPRKSLNDLAGDLKNKYNKIVFNHKVDKDYLVIFFQSALGKLCLKSCYYGQHLAHFDISLLNQVSFALPSKPEQHMVVLAYKQLKQMEEGSLELKSQLAIHPNNKDLHQHLGEFFKEIETIAQSERLKKSA